MHQWSRRVLRVGRGLGKYAGRLLAPAKDILPGCGSLITYGIPCDRAILAQFCLFLDMRGGERVGVAYDIACHGEDWRQKVSGAPWLLVKGE